MSVRTRRLGADHDRVRHSFSTHPFIWIVETQGEPPERYLVGYRLRGLVVQGNEVVEKSEHLVEFFLTLGYPRQAPQCRMLTPIYHPNIAPHAVCVGDHWSAGESLAALIVRVGEMITYQSYNLKSPLNGAAAKWAAENVERLPVQAVDLSIELGEPPRRMARSADPPAANPEPEGELPAPPPMGPSDGQSALVRGQEAMRSGHIAQAILAFGEAILARPTEAEGWRLRAFARLAVGDRKGATSDFEVVLSLHPDHERADWMRKFVADNSARPR